MSPALHTPVVRRTEGGSGAQIAHYVAVADEVRQVLLRAAARIRRLRSLRRRPALPPVHPHPKARRPRRFEDQSIAIYNKRASLLGVETRLTHRELKPKRAAHQHDHQHAARPFGNPHAFLHHACL